MDSFFQRIDRLAIFFIVYTLAFFAFFKTLSYTLPFVLAFLIALILRIPTRFLMKKVKLKNSSAALITTFSFYAVFFVFIVKIIVALINEIIILTTNISTYLTNHRQYIYDFANRIKDMYNNIDPTVLNAIESNLSQLTNKLSSTAASIATSLANGVINFMTNSIPYIIMLFIFTLISTYFFTRDISASSSNQITSHFTRDISKAAYIFRETKRMLLNYTKSYLILISITFVVTLIGFSIFRVPYSFLLSLLCALLDLMPVVGMPIVYGPLAIYYFANNNYIVAIGLLILYAILFISRQIIEPKLVSANLGLHPVEVLAAFFIGLQLAGFSGMIYCIFLVVFYNIFKKVDVL